MINRRNTSIAIFLFITSLAFTEPPFQVNTGKQLDKWWNQYFATNDSLYINNIIEYINTDDILLKSINENIILIKKNKEILQILTDLNINILGTRINPRYDLDIMTGILLRNDEYTDKINKLYSFFKNKDELVVRSAIKSAAFWSLLANSRQRANVRTFIEKDTNILKTSSRNLYNDMSKK